MSHCKRLCLYSFSDPAGIADRCVLRLLDELRPHCTEIAVVLSGAALTKSAEESLSARCDRLIGAQGALSPLAAWGKGIGAYSAAALAAFDEILCLDDSLLGPCRPLDGFFSEMDAREADFWSLCPRYPQQRADRRVFAEGSLLAFRRPVIASGALPDALAQNAGKLTELLLAAGFRFDSFVGGDALSSFAYDPLRFAPLRLVREMGCPFFSREIFSLPPRELYALSDRSEAAELLAYLREQKLFDTDLAWEHLLRRCHLGDLQRSLALRRVLGADGCGESGHSPACALLLMVRDEQALLSAAHCAHALPHGGDLFVCCADETLKSAAEELFADGGWHKLSVCVQANPGLGAGLAPEEYALVCVVCPGGGAEERDIQNVLPSRDRVEQIFSLFADNERLGVLMSAEEASADWAELYESLCRAHDELGLRCPLAPDRAPFAPRGAFWCRPAVLERLRGADALSARQWLWLLPYAAQDAGLYTASVLTDANAAAEWARLSRELREINYRAFRAFGYHDFNGLVKTLDRFRVYPARRALGLRELWPLLIVKIKRFVPKRLKRRLGELYAALKKAVRGKG